MKRQRFIIPVRTLPCQRAESKTRPPNHFGHAGEIYIEALQSVHRWFWKVDEEFPSATVGAGRRLSGCYAGQELPQLVRQTPRHWSAHWAIWRMISCRLSSSSTGQALSHVSSGLFCGREVGAKTGRAPPTALAKCSSVT